MHEKHRQIRLTMKLSDWLYTIVDTNWKTLEHLNSSVKSHLEASEPIPSLRGGGQDDSDAEPAVPQDHVVLYKTLPFVAFKETFTEDGCIHLGKLQSERPTDFAGRGGLYLTPQLWVAMYYADALNDICVSADVRTLSLHVPCDYINSLKTWRLEYGDQWRELIWHSRRSEYYPAAWQKHHSRQELIIGPIAHGANQHFSKMKNWEKIGTKNVIMSKDGSDTSSQYVFMKTQTVQDLQEKVRGKAYLHQIYGNFKVIVHPWSDKL
ncbi:hypothetical protein BDU57DRAFT_522468, partial [Ampelomyces quisqualis]